LTLQPMGHEGTRTEHDKTRRRGRNEERFRSHKLLESTRKQREREREI